MGCNQPERRPLSEIRRDRVLQHKLPWNSELAVKLFRNFSNHHHRLNRENKEHMSWTNR